MSQRTQSVVIVGGGTAGWLTAGIIAARHKGRMSSGFSVTLVESPTVPIIGVGEGTWPTLRSTLQKMGVSETDFFRHCNAAFKQGAKFARWTTGADDDAYYHPLMLPQGFTQVNLAPHWLCMGGGSFWRGTIAVLLLFVCNYLSANVVALFVDRLMKRKGRVFGDRYHAHILKTPREAARALRYVLMNFAHHAKSWGERVSATFIDPFSSVRYLAVDPGDAAPVAEPRTWLLRMGWVGAG